MKHPYLIPSKFGNKTYFHFRSKIPIDLIPTFSGRKEFQISLKNVSNKETLLVSVSLQTLTEQLFNDLRKGMKTLTLEDAREILKVDVRKSILHSHHVHLETNKYDPQKIENSLTSVSMKEDQLKQKLKQDLKTYEDMLDEKLKKILLSLDIEFDNHTVNYKLLRRYFIDSYLLRFEFTRNLVNETGRTDDDFRKEVEEKLKVHLSPELKEQPTPEVSSVSTTFSEVQKPLTSHQATLISVGIENYLDERGKIRTKSLDEIKNSLNMMIEEWGDTRIGSITREMITNFNGHIRKLPRNRNKNPKYRDKDFHELVKMNVKDKIHTTTVNKLLGYCTSFYEWSVNHGYSNTNPFKGLKLKKESRPRDERDRFSELELKKNFQKENYIH